MSIQGISKLMWCIEFVVSRAYNLSRRELKNLFFDRPTEKIMQNDTSKREEFDLKQFQNPSTEFRGAPFWAWNTKLDKTELLRQIDCFHQMGFGGFFMHSRADMATEYLCEEFMSCVRACVEYAEKLGMKANLYDEDRWPSGFAGGYVTEDKNLRQMQICLSLKAPEEFLRVYRDFERDPHLLTVYDIVFDDYDRLADYHIISADAQAKGEKWYAYRIYKPCCGYHNGYTYADTMKPEAVEKFIAVTHEKYKREIGEEFGKTVGAIFTDEPNYGRIFLKAFARDGEDAFFPWTEKFPELYQETYRENILERLPELVWNLQGNKPSAARYRFYRLASELFSSTYCDRVGAWCAKNGIAFVGHTLDEDSLHMQTCAVGESMRTYKAFTVPGIDMLCNDREFTTAKQAQSVAHQYGRKGTLSELYGVTGWDFDFRGHKFQGDWQAALGVTLRVPHLSWLSMQGSAKRDYPASIGCQSSWYKEYGYLENHFARLNTALTRGKPVVRIAVLHPIESAWIGEGVREHSAAAVALDKEFKNIAEWLLRGQIDFDYISESLLPEQFKESDAGFCVGQMCYSAVIVPQIVTVRETTLNVLVKFLQKGGKVFVCGDFPKLVDGVQSDIAQAVWLSSQKVSFTETAILTALEEERDVAVFGGNGQRREDFIYQLRAEGQERWLFLAHCDPPVRADGADCVCDNLKIVVKGHCRATLMNTLDGTAKELFYRFQNGNTVIFTPCYAYDSFLFRLLPTEIEPQNDSSPKEEYKKTPLDLPDFVQYELTEPNALVLDQCEWSLNDIDFQPREEILRIDKSIRKKLGYPLANGEDVQPWRIPPKEPSVFVWLRFYVESEIETDCALGYEKCCGLWVNGAEIPVADSGYYVDKAIRTMALPKLRKGANEIIIKAPISERVSVENYFLLGSFGVTTVGACTKIVPLPEKITFGSITEQGFPFYGGAVTYKIPFECKEGNAEIVSDYYNGALISARLDGKEIGKIVLPPYKLTVSVQKSGKHLLELTLYASRINTFGALHAAVPIRWKGSNMWYTEGNAWAYEYQLTDVGIMKKPILKIWYNKAMKKEANGEYQG